MNVDLLEIYNKTLLKYSILPSSSEITNNSLLYCQWTWLYNKNSFSFCFFFPSVQLNETIISMFTYQASEKWH